MAKLNLRPLDDRVVVRPLEAEEVTAGGIVGEEGYLIQVGDDLHAKYIRESRMPETESIESRIASASSLRGVCRHREGFGSQRCEDGS